MSKVVCEILCWRFLAGQWSTVGRPVEVDSNQIETLNEDNQRYTTQERADILKISKSIKLIGENEKCVFYFTKQTFWPTQYYLCCEL